MEHVLRLERAVLDATDVLAVRGIRCVALKGVALANGVYAHPADRTFVDADLLIDPTRYVDAIDALLASGRDAISRRCEPGWMRGSPRMSRWCSTGRPSIYTAR